MKKNITAEFECKKDVSAQIRPFCAEISAFKRTQLHSKFLILAKTQKLA